MKIGIQTWGSTGDVRPFIALAAGLKEAGHEVTLYVTSVDDRDYSSYGAASGYNVISTNRCGIAPERLKNLALEIVGRKNPLTQLKIILDNFFYPFIDHIYSASKELCADNDIAVGHFIVHTLSTVAEKSGIPYVSVSLNHGMIPSRHVTPSGFPEIGRWFNPLLWRFLEKLADETMIEAVNDIRKREGLASVRNVFRESLESRLLNLIAVSEVFCKRRDDWTDNHRVTGFLSPPGEESGWEMPGDLKKFLKDSDAPVFITFGSMMLMDPDPHATTQLLVEAVKEAGVRAIIQSRWDEIEGIPDDPEIYRIGAAPHSAIFKYCSAVVHHGGAGTTHSATLSGRPSVVVEHLADQLFWGNELRRLEIAPRPLHRRSVTVQKLAKAIRKVDESVRMFNLAHDKAEQMKEENGVQCAVSLIEKISG